MTKNKKLNTDDLVAKYFDFLTNDFDFIKIPSYNYSREVHFDFIKDNLIVKVCYDGGFFVSILKSKQPEPDLIMSKKRTIDYDSNFFRRYDLRHVDIDKRIFNSINVHMSNEEEIKHNSDLLRQNPEILIGDIRKLTFRNYLMKRIKNWL